MRATPCPKPVQRIPLIQEMALKESPKPSVNIVKDLIDSSVVFVSHLDSLPHGSNRRPC